MVRLGASIGILFLGGGPACVYLHDGKILFISSGCSYYVYSIKHILNMHLIFISIRIWRLISFMTIDSFQAICILFCSLLFISSVLSEEFKHPSRDCPQVMNCTPSFKNQHSKACVNPLLFLCIYWAFCAWLWCLLLGWQQVMLCMVSSIYCMTSCGPAWSFPVERHISPPALVGSISLPCQGTGSPGAVDYLTAESQIPPLFRKSLLTFVPDSWTRTRNISLPNPLPPQRHPLAWHFIVS